MKALIVEDDFVSRVVLQEILRKYGTAHIAVNGKEAVEAANTASEAGEPYDLICMDVMMPEMDGQTALRLIRGKEEARGIVSTRGARIIMTTALSDMANIAKSFDGLCDDYLVKPIDRIKLIAILRELGLVP